MVSEIKFYLDKKKIYRGNFYFYIIKYLDMKHKITNFNFPYSDRKIPNCVL